MTPSDAHTLVAAATTAATTTVTAVGARGLTKLTYRHYDRENHFDDDSYNDDKMAGYECARDECQVIRRVLQPIRDHGARGH